MFNLFRKNCLYNDSIEPHCAYCVHCKPENEYQGVCEFRGIVATAGSCRRFTYDALRRKPPKPARIRGRFTAEDFFFEEAETAKQQKPAEPEEAKPVFRDKPLIPDDLSQFADFWEDEDENTAPNPTLEQPEKQIEPAEEAVSASTDTEKEPAPMEPVPTDSDVLTPQSAEEENPDEA